MSFLFWQILLPSLVLFLLPVAYCMGRIDERMREHTPHELDMTLLSRTKKP